MTNAPLRRGHGRLPTRMASGAAALALLTALAAAPPAAAAAGDLRVFKIAGHVAEVDDPWDLFGLTDKLVFSELLDAIAKEGVNPRAKTLLIKLGPTDLGLAQLDGLAAALGRVRALGKRVLVHMDSGSGAEMGLATAGDSLNLTPEGVVVLTGLQAEVSFYKELLAKLGVEADIEAIGKYKSAAEPWTRSEMSAEAREALGALMDSLYAAMTQRIATQRKLDPVAVAAIIDVGLLTAEEARKAKLVDTTVPWTELLEAEKKRHAATAVAYPVVTPLPDMSSLWGLFSLLTRKPDAAAGKGARVAIVAAQGPIIMGERGLSLFDSDALIAAGDLVRTLRKVRADKTVKAVVLRLDSPGGSALASDVVWQEVRRLGEQVPVVASLGNVAASGGYYIASAAKRIVAEPTTITGSIGVFGGKLVLGGLLDKIGVHTVVLKRGKHAGLFSSLTRFSDSERALLRRHMQHTYDTFVNRVAKGRRMSYDAVHRVGQGRVWSGKQARDVGLVDALGGLDEAVAAAAKLAGLDPKAIERVTYPEARSLLEMLQDDKVQLKLLGGAPLLKLLSQVAPAAPALAKRLLAAVTTLQAILAREPTAAMLPFVLTVR